MRGVLLLLTVVCGCDAGARLPSPPQQTAPAPVPTPREPAVPAALVIVLNGQELFVGNDRYEPDENARYAGVSAAIDYAFTRHSPARLLPPGSQGALVAFATELGIRHGLDVLAKVDARRRLLLIIADQHDSNSEAAKPKLQTMGREADDLGIERLHVDYGGLPVAGPVAYDGEFGPVRLAAGHDSFADIIGELFAP